MKKHEEGYALVLVLVVILVLGMVASALLTLSLRNLQSQTASIERMKAKYAAAGEIEKVVAQMNDWIENPPETPATLKDLLGDDYTAQEKEDGKAILVSFTKSAEHNESKAVISCTLLLTAENVGKLSDKEFKITNLQTVTYESYDISYEQIPEGGGTG